MTPVGPGTLLLCIKDNHSFRSQHWWINSHTIYTCEYVIPGGEVVDGACPDCGTNFHEAFSLVEKRRYASRERHIVYCPTFFLPLSPPDPIEIETQEEIRCPELI